MEISEIKKEIEEQCSYEKDNVRLKTKVIFVASFSGSVSNFFLIVCETELSYDDGNYHMDRHMDAYFDDGRPIEETEVYLSDIKEDWKTFYEEAKEKIISSGRNSIEEISYT